MKITDEDRRWLEGKLVVASVSGGKDSAAMSLWLTENGIAHVRVFSDTHWEADSTYAYLRGPLTRALGLIDEVECPLTFPCPHCGATGLVHLSGEPFRDGDVSGVQCPLCLGEGLLRGMGALVLHKGMFPSRVRRFCTQELKVFPLARFVKAQAELHDCEVVNAVGIRAEESEARQKMPSKEYQETFDAEVWRPLLTWTLEDVVAIHRAHDLVPNPLYLAGASRVGCWPCIYARKDEVRHIAEKDAARIDRIRLLEHYATVASDRRALARDGVLNGNPKPAFFGKWQLGEGTRQCAPIDEVVAWSKTASGGRNLALFAPGPEDEGCARWGMCGSYDGGWPSEDAGVAQESAQNLEETKRDDCSGVEKEAQDVQEDARFQDRVGAGAGEGRGQDDPKRIQVQGDAVPGSVPRQGSLFLEAGS